MGSDPNSYYPSRDDVKLQPLTYHGYVAANGYQVLASLPEVDARLIGLTGHSYGGKWALFGSCLYDKFAATAWSDPGIVFDEKEPMLITGSLGTLVMKKASAVSLVL